MHPNQIYKKEDYMDTNSRVICEIMGLKVTYFMALQDGMATNSYFAICNSESEVVSQKYRKIAEPMTILLEIEKLVSEQNKNSLSQMI